MVNDHFASFNISIETSVTVNDLYTTSVYVTMSISPLPGPPQDPTQVPVEYPLMNIALAFVQTVRVVEQIGATILLIALLVGSGITTYGAISKAAASLLPWLLV